LEGVVSGWVCAKDAPANAADQSAVPPHQLGESGLIALLSECGEQLAVGYCGIGVRSGQAA
jgi:hypothetical protein